MEDYIRIPVSLKFDKNSSFYREFVAPKRESRELSEFIVNLMRVYYENDRLRVALDEAIDELTPFGKIKKQLERIHLEHSKVLMTTAVLSSQVSQIIDKVENAVHDEDKPRLPPVVRETPALLERILKLEQILPSLDAKLDAVLSTLQEALPIGGNQQETASVEGSGVSGKTDSINVGNETSNNFASTDSNHEIVIDSLTANEKISAAKEELVNEEKDVPIVLPSAAPVIGEEDGEARQEESVSSSSQHQEGKPRVASANFGKLLKSVKKK